MSQTEKLKGNFRRIRPAYEQVADQLRQMIIQMDVRPGERLPREGELTVLLGVSRSTVREALRVLQSEKLIITTRGVQGGSFIAHPEPAHISDFLQANLGLLSGADQLSIDDLLEARELLEVPAAALAATRRSEEQLEELRQFASGTGAIEAFSENRDFHLSLLEASGNMLLGVMTRPVFTVLQSRFLRAEAARDQWESVHKDHESIYEAIAAGDAELAGKRMFEHLQHLRPTYIAMDVIDRAAREDGTTYSPDGIARIARTVAARAVAPDAGKEPPARAKPSAAQQVATTGRKAPAKRTATKNPPGSKATAPKASAQQPTKAVATKAAARKS
ncbi:unannotated protein [freshwater metagenome]|uniref:Unannotated protein n=1 Tax=freshwater metagenome TaxID=449393 RepID=A0A6J7EZD4_9ZZZZ|nr:FCD domain-containing protein [Actinomycetota bacterium]